MMAPAPKRTVAWSGSTEEPVSWEGLVSIFDSLIGSELHDLPKYPQVIGGTTAKWIDGEGNEHELDSLEALQTPYSEKKTGRITVSSRTGDGEAMFDYWPGAPRPRIRATLTANVDEVQARLSEITQVFPDPFEGAVIFLSWGGDPSRSIAQVLHRMFEARFPSADVFFSPESIDIGDDPMKELFEKHLLQAQALIAVITVDAANRPWVIWEIASTWAR